MSKLKTLLLRKKIDDAKKALDALRAKDADFDQREADLAEAFGEITAENTEEERTAIEEQMNTFDAEKEAHESEKKDLEEVIRSAEEELEEAEKKQDEKPAEEPAPAPVEEPAERTMVNTMNKRSVFRNMNMQERTAFVSNEGVKNWLSEIRSAIKEKRAITNVGLTIPTEVLPLLRENIAVWSKLYDRVNLVRIGGEARQPIMGTIPEAIWTECCANLNEMTLGFNDWEVDCYKVGGYYAICNANLEDSDIDLAAVIIEALGQGIGKALDKAILYGRNISTNSKMPLGVVSRLLQTTQPADYPATARTWADLHESHVISAGSAAGVALIKALVNASAVAANDYSRGAMTWVMNDKTYKKIVAETLEVNASGAVVSAINGVIPVAGGDAVVLNFMPDDVIVFGYFDLYLLAERAARKFAQSEHVRFLQDQTVFKGTARYDGAPVIAESFGIVTLGTATASASAVTFPQDTAN